MHPNTQLIRTMLARRIDGLSPQLVGLLVFRDGRFDQITRHPSDNGLAVEKRRKTVKNSLIPLERPGGSDS